ncbi:hypothetical protein SAMN04488058_10450 [Deinococcus reticulitermitis]|uniref:NfeD-like C-terminal domain-containing protein n=1 Tax=Deinococcus reticulitermitis TaxID=856736 RepID=A0A1H6W9F4_9DEIO|nr:hypothetical protein SAMN04488058_10450 [Deinococcus reticulitermitis]
MAMPDWLPSLNNIDPWHWWVLGGSLLLLELAAPGVFFVWLALAAFGLGLLSSVIPLDVPGQLLLFAGLSVAAVWLGRHYLGRLSDSGEGDALNRGAERLLGRTVTVTAPITHGSGRVRVGDSDWRASGPDLPVGAAVRVIGVEGSTLIVQEERRLEGP